MRSALALDRNICSVSGKSAQLFTRSCLMASSFKTISNITGFLISMGKGSSKPMLQQQQIPRRLYQPAPTPLSLALPYPADDTNGIPLIPLIIHPVIPLLISSTINEKRRSDLNEPTCTIRSAIALGIG